ncbi:MAG: Gfo/Idh/MocA family oxidoreductase, partial [Candidatus Omnitrophota bacterium]
MTKRLKIGIVGCGAIGTSLAKIIVKEFKAGARLAAVYDTDMKRSALVARSIIGNRRSAAGDLKSLIARCDLVIEAASAKCSLGVAREVLAAGRDIIVMSVGGVVGEYRALSKLAAGRNARLYIPSGAIAGIDALKASKLGRIKSVTLTTRKPPLSFKSVPYIESHSIDL